MIKPTLNQDYDVKDSLNRWFEGKIVQVTRATVKVHYPGWSALFDETIPVSSIQSRLAPHKTHAPVVSIAYMLIPKMLDFV
jgi:hypothetical protein